MGKLNRIPYPLYSVIWAIARQESSRELRQVRHDAWPVINKAIRPAFYAWAGRIRASHSNKRCGSEWQIFVDRGYKRDD